MKNFCMMDEFISKEIVLLNRNFMKNLKGCPVAGRGNFISCLYYSDNTRKLEKGGYDGETF